MEGAHNRPHLAGGACVQTRELQASTVTTYRQKGKLEKQSSVVGKICFAFIKDFDKNN